MSRIIPLYVLAIAFAALVCPSSSLPKSPIEHVVVLMLENRAFDHMVGYLKQSLNSEIDGLNGDESNPFHPGVPHSPYITVSDDAPYAELCPGHEVPDATEQIFGGPYNYKLDPPPMNGFLANSLKVNGNQGTQVMKCFNSTSVPAISTLAAEFAIFDRWYSSVPGPTEVNRAYVHSATSNGMGENDLSVLLEGLPQKTIFNSLSDAGIDWTVYMEEVSTTLFFAQMRKLEYLENFKDYNMFLSDAKDGKLPAYSFIEPRYFDILGYPANDQHPSHDVWEGDFLIKNVYETLRASPVWNSTLFIVTYDEHGGFYDHVPPPMDNVPNPDGIDSLLPPFNFTRLGIRVPTLMASPWINKGTVVHEPADGTNHYEHSSVIATLNLLYGLEPLTKRDAGAATFEGVVSERPSPRTDGPEVLPSVVKLTATKSADGPINDLQHGFLMACSYMNGGTDDSWKSIKTEFAAAAFCAKQRDILLGRN
eukprot:TRINITY_DN7759_c0_g1_i1.p1 TRINITY_DN7759_c0_g1~~TRINITY_DN7759_c0_g1_i1.p1  ORF type:complete len:479 (+),score=77.80 TRINITY_DN7759_c0_g1_i1:172-1608(+)